MRTYHIIRDLWTDSLRIDDGPALEHEILATVHAQGALGAWYDYRDAINEVRSCQAEAKESLSL